MSRVHEARCWYFRNSVMFLFIAALGAGAFAPAQIVAQSAAPTPSRQIETDSGWQLSTSHFNNSFEAEPYVGNGFIGLRVPAAGMGFLGELGKVGWPIGTERVASAIAAGVYAKVADGSFYHDEK